MPSCCLHTRSSSPSAAVAAHLAALLALLAAPPGTTSIQEWVQAGADLDGDPSLNPFGSTEVYFGTACAISSDGLTVAVAGGAVGVTPGHVRVFRREGTHYAQVSGNLAVSAPATSILLSADGTWLAAGSLSENSVTVSRFRGRCLVPVPPRDLAWSDCSVRHERLCLGQRHHAHPRCRHPQHQRRIGGS